MPGQQCPGMSSKYFKLNDIKEYKCIHCGTVIEFWKDDIKVKCSKCGKENFNPNLGNTCLVWCKEASKCLGKEVNVKEWIEKHKDITPQSENEKEDKDCAS